MGTTPSPFKPTASPPLPNRHGFHAALLIPALNEAEVIGRVLAAVPSGLFSQILVIDNGSTDATAEQARSAGATVVAEPARGYGRACLTGLRQLRPEIDAVVFMDADFSDDPGDAENLLQKLAEGFELVIGSRMELAQPEALTPHQRFGNWLATRLIAWRWQIRFTDLGPFRAIRREALDRLGMRDENYGWTVEMQAQAARVGLRCTEIPVRYRPRAGGRSKVSGSIKGSILAGTKILWTFAQIARQGGKGRAV
jgi:glycosyltransferase involved in cell wall biosynthesis